MNASELVERHDLLVEEIKLFDHLMESNFLSDEDRAEAKSNKEALAKEIQSIRQQLIRAGWHFTI